MRDMLLIIRAWIVTLVMICFEVKEDLRRPALMPYWLRSRRVLCSDLMDNSQLEHALARLLFSKSFRVTVWMRCDLA